MRKMMIVMSAAAMLPLGACAGNGLGGMFGGGDTYANRGGYYDASRYYRDGNYNARPMNRNDTIYRGSDGRYYCKRDNGTTGLVIGAGVGALAGHELAGRGDRTLGAILGGAVGALVGREIDRGSLSCR